MYTLVSIMDQPTRSTEAHVSSVKASVPKKIVARMMEATIPLINKVSSCCHTYSVNVKSHMTHDTYKLAMANTPSSASLLTMGNLRFQMVPMGRIIIATSRMNPGSACAWKNSWISKQRPPGMVLSQKKARGMHWKHAVTVKARDVAAVKANMTQAVIRMAPFQLKRRR